MLIDNRLAMIILGVLLGCAVNISVISSQALLLSTAQPVYTLYLALACNLLFSAFLNKIHLTKIKFSHFSAMAMGVYLVLNFALSFHFASDFIRALLWFFLSTLGNRFFLWMTSELALQHLDPARAQSSFSYLAMADEIGSLAAVISLKAYGSRLTTDLTLDGVSLLFLAGLAFVAFQFFPKRNLEIHFTKKTVDPPLIEKKIFRGFVILFVLVSTSLGVFKVTEDYLIKVVMKQELVSYQAIRDMTANFMFCANVLTISLTLGLGRLIEQKRLSPMWMFSFQTLVMVAFCLACLIYPQLYLFLVFDVVRRVVQNCFYSPANQMILSSFIGEFRNRLRSYYNLYYYTVTGIVLAVAFSYTQRFVYSVQLKILLGVLLATLGLSLGMLKRLGRSLKDVMYAFVQSGHKTASIIAVNMLSFLRPKGYGMEMNKLLAQSPKKLLRKIIIVGLGYDGKRDSLDAVMNEFKSDKEEIQMAVLEALKAARNYQATQFMVKIIMAQERANSLRVRMNASLIVAGIYGRKAIPFLLNGLEDPDPRIVANTLETLSIYKDKALLSYFRHFSQSENYRVRANALMGLAPFKSTREQYRITVKNTLIGQDLPMISSVLYVIGKMKDSYFKKELDNLKNSPLGKEEQIRSSLAWAFIQLNDQEGFELMEELLSLPYEEGKSLPALHFLSQLNRETRFDLIQHLVRQHLKDPETLANFGNHLRHSIFDFHEEIEYLHLLSLAS
jgi:HEAT repeat protein